MGDVFMPRRALPNSDRKMDTRGVIEAVSLAYFLLCGVEPKVKKTVVGVKLLSDRECVDFHKHPDEQLPPSDLVHFSMGDAK